MEEFLLEGSLTPRHIEIMKIIMVVTNEFSVFNELYEIFGPELFLKFLNIFAGTTFTIPDPSSLSRLVRDIDIYLTVKKKGLPGVVKELSMTHQMQEKDVRKICTRIDEIVNTFQKAVKARRGGVLI